MATSKDPLAWRRQFCRGQWKEQEGEEDRRRDGKITSRNGREWGLAIPWGQRKTRKGGKVLLQHHLWCPDDLQDSGTEMKWDDVFLQYVKTHTDRVKRIWYLSHMRAAKGQASLRIRAVSPEPSLHAHTSSESRGTFRQKARSLAPLNGWACAVKICHDGMLEDTNSLDGAHILSKFAGV